MRGWDVAGMVTVRITRFGFNDVSSPSTALAGLQAASAGIPWLPIPIEGEEETEMQHLEFALESCNSGVSNNVQAFGANEIESVEWPEGWIWPEGLSRLRPNLPIDALVVGALRSDYQKQESRQMCHRLGIKSFCPLWHHNSIEHMRDLVKHNHKVMMTSVTSDGLDEHWLGRMLNSGKLGRVGEKLLKNSDFISMVRGENSRRQYSMHLG